MSTLLSSTDIKWTKTCLIIGGCAVAGISAYSLYSYYQNKSRMIDEGFEDICVSFVFNDMINNVKIFHILIYSVLKYLSFLFSEIVTLFSRVFYLKIFF